MKKEVRDALEEIFNLYEDDKTNELELEAWTTGGVDMFITVNPAADKPISSQLRDYASGFDIWEEIELYINDRDYRSNFTLKESYEDFDDWVKWVLRIADEIEGVE